MLRGFDALQRIADNYVGSEMPVGWDAEEELVYVDGYLRIQFRIQRPRDNNDGTFLEDSGIDLVRYNPPGVVAELPRKPAGTR